MNGLKQFFVCEDDIKELQYVSPWIIVIIADIILWALAKKLPVRLTSLLRDHNDGISESETHQQGRAVDLGVIGWTKKDIDDCANYINEKYKLVGATSSKTGKPNTCYYHNNGNGWHFHIQVKPLQFIKGVSICLQH